MAFYLHILNLRDDVTHDDLKDLFEGLEIEEDGIVITGSPDGEAFVTFGNQTDLLKALGKDGEGYLNIKLATESQRQDAINRMRRLEKIQKIQQFNAEELAQENAEQWDHATTTQPGTVLSTPNTVKASVESLYVQNASSVKAQIFTMQDEAKQETEILKSAGDKAIVIESDNANGSDQHDAKRKRQSDSSTNRQAGRDQDNSSHSRRSRKRDKSRGSKRSSDTSSDSESSGSSSSSSSSSRSRSRSRNKSTSRSQDAGKSRGRDKSTSRNRGRNKRRRRSLDRSRSRSSDSTSSSRSRSRSRDTNRHRRGRDKGRSRSRVRDKDRSRSRGRDRDRSRSRGRDRDRSRSRGRDRSRSRGRNKERSRSRGRDKDRGRARITGSGSSRNKSRSRQNAEPSYAKSSFTLDDSLHMAYLLLKGFDPRSTPSEISSWFQGARGVVVAHYRPGLSELAFVAFATRNECNKAIDINLWKKGAKNFPHEEFTGDQALTSIAKLALENDIRISTMTKQDRKLNEKEQGLLLTIQNKTKSGSGSSAPSQTNSKSADRLNEPIKTEPQSHMPSSSFYQQLLTFCTDEEKELYIVVFKLDKGSTACEVLSWYVDCDPVCAAKVNFFETGPLGSEAIGVVLLKDGVDQESARNHCNRLERPFSFYKKKNLVALLTHLCIFSTFSESTSYGQDRPLTAEHVKALTTNFPFTFVHGSPCLCYAHLKGLKSDATACTVWSWFGGAKGLAKGVILTTRKVDNVALEAYVAFASWDKYVEAITATSCAGKWETFRKVTEDSVLKIIATCARSPFLVVKVSTRSDEDREINSSEQQRLDSIKLRANTDKTEQLLGKNAFYIRLRKVPSTVTACEILSWYTADGGHGKSVTLIVDPNGKNLFAYVMFEESEHRQSAMTTRKFAKTVTTHARGVCLAKLSSDHLILESTGTADRYLTVDERDALRKVFAPHYGMTKKKTKLNEPPGSFCIGHIMCTEPPGLT